MKVKIGTIRAILIALVLVLIVGTASLIAQDEAAKEHFNAGVDAEAAGDAAKAVTEYNAAIEADPAFAGPRYNLGVLLYSQKKYKEAMQQFSKVAEIEPTNVDAWKNMGLSATEIGDLNSGEKAFAEALKIKHNDPELTEDFAMLFYKNNAYDRAIGKLEDLVKLKNQDKVTFYALGKSYKETGNTAMAVTNLQSATKIDPKYQLAYFELGNIYYDQSIWSKAISNYEKSVEYDPKHYQSWYNLGYAYYSESTDESVMKSYEAFKKFAGITKGMKGNQIAQMRANANNVITQLEAYFDDAGIDY